MAPRDAERARRGRRSVDDEALAAEADLAHAALERPFDQKPFPEPSPFDQSSSLAGEEAPGEARLDGDELAVALEPGGRVASALPDYEERPQQVDMVRAVCEAFNGHGVLLVEAGTGVGKSLAYLLPSFEWIRRTGERVVVSTNTINLQEQLFGKDIPLVRAATGLEVDAVLLKGRQNYVCPRRLEFLAGEGADLTPSGAEGELAELAAWADRTQDGTLADLPFVPRNDVWDEVASDRDRCEGGQCACAGRCFYLLARRRAAAAPLVVVNHHLLLADLSLRLEGAEPGVVIPPFTRLVVDEAHHLEAVARNHLGSSMTCAGVTRMASRLAGEGRPGGRAGVLLHLYNALSGRLGATSTTQGRRLMAAADRAAQVASDARRVNDALLRAGLGFAEASARPDGPSDASGEGARLVAPVERSTLKRPAWTGELAPALEDLGAVLGSLSASLEAVLASAQDLEEPEKEKVASALADASKARRQAASAAQALARFQDVEDASCCRWLEASSSGGRRGASLKLCCSPFDVSGPLREHLFDRLDSAVLTSATLAVGQSFEFCARGLGLSSSGIETIVAPAGRVRTLRLTSPFDYRERVLLGIPSDLPDPGAPAFVEKLAELLPQVVAVTRGRAIVLFTSYRMMRDAFARSESALRALGVTPMKQGDESRERLLKRLVDEDPAVLFGTSSFWEGIDVRGPALSCVVIVKLPFQVPSEPLVAARGAWLERQGLDPFRDESLPRAVLQLKQGFGRLIRCHDDAGAVLILDHRILKKAYGRVFLQSLPDVKPTTGPWTKILAALKEFAARRMA